MAEKNHLRPASFRSIPFKIKRASTRVGRRIITHEFPLKEEPYTEDLGKGAREYTLEAHVIGDGHEDARDRLIQAIEGNKDPGILIHPIFGAVRVIPGPVEHVFDNSEGNIEYFNFTFYEAGENKYPSSVLNTGGQVEAFATLLGNALTISFQESFFTKRLPGFVEATAQSTNMNLVEALQKAATVAPTLPVPHAIFTEALQTLATKGSTLMAVPPDYTIIVQHTINAVQKLFANPAAGFAAYARLSTFGDDFMPIPQTSPNRRTQKRNRDAQVALVKRQALIGMAVTASQMTFPSYDDAVKIRNQIADQFDTELEIIGATDDDDVFNALSDLKAAMILDISSRAANLARIKQIFPAEPLPAIVLSYEIYGSIEQADEIRPRNKVRNPNFMPAGRAVQILIE